MLTHFEPDMSDEFLRRGVFKANVIFRGGYYGNMEIPGFKEDFQLIPKEEENIYLEKTLAKGQKWRENRKIPKFTELPPMIKLMLEQEALEKNVELAERELKLPLVVRTGDTFSHSCQE